MNQIIAGLLVNNSWNNNSNSLEIVHFNFTKQEQWNVIIKKCDNPNCSIGNFDIEGNCILSVNKSMAILLNEKLSKVGQFLKIK